MIEVPLIDMKKLLSVLFAISVVSSLLWLSKQPVSAVENIRVAQDHLLKGNYAEAIQLFETLSEGGTDRHAGRSGLLQACLITGQYEKVEQLAQRFLRSSRTRRLFQIFSESLNSAGESMPELYRHLKVLSWLPHLQNEASWTVLCFSRPSGGKRARLIFRRCTSER